MIEHFLETNKKELVDFIQALQRPIPSGHDVFGRLVNELVVQIPMEKDGVRNVTDKAHVELGITIIEALWCGWLSQAKANRDVYTRDTPERFRQMINKAYKIGQRYATSRP